MRSGTAPRFELVWAMGFYRWKLTRRGETLSAGYYSLPLLWRDRVDRLGPIGGNKKMVSIQSERGYFNRRHAIPLSSVT